MGPPPGALPPMRMTASWSGSNRPTEYKSVARRCAPMASSPRILNRPTDRHRPETDAMQSPPRRSSSLRVLRRQGAAKHKQRQAARRQALLPFRSLDPLRALRETDRRRRDEERPSRSEQRTDYKPKSLLDRKNPIQVCIRPRGTFCARLLLKPLSASAIIRHTHQSSRLLSNKHFLSVQAALKTRLTKRLCAFR